MSKQNKSKNKAHLFENAGPVSTINNSNVNKTASIASIATGGLTLADSIYTPFRDINNADVQLVKPTNVSQINDLDTLQTFRRQLEPQQISYSDVGGHSAGQSWANIGKGAGAGASVGAGIGSFVGPIGTVIGAGVGGILGGGISAISEAFGGKRAKQKQKEEQALADANYNTQLSMLNNQAYNISANQLAEKQFGYINALGGNLHSNSTTWSNGLNYIGSGGSHESNPNDGVAISTAPDGLQNKVEEGEVVWNDDYVFSRRLKVPKKDLEKNKWKGETYADIAKKLMDESAERPNDPITLRGLDDSLSRLRGSQEELKAKQEGNKIKKEIASIPPELLAQMQQAQQQPTEKELMQQQAMGQMLQEQMPLVDPSIQQPMMEQPPMYAKGGHLFSGGSRIDEANELIYGYNKETADKYEIAKTKGFKGSYDDFVDYLKLFDGKDSKDGVRITKSLSELEGKSDKSASSSGDWSTYARFAPVVGSAIGAISSMFNIPDYDNPKRIERIAKQIASPISPKYIGDYLRYRPLDEAYYLNQLNAQQNAANNAIVGLSNGNRSMALASMLANDYNYNNQRGAAYRQGLEYNEAQRQRAAEFNRGTNQFNAQQYMQAAAQNASNRAQAANLISAAAQMREGIDNAYGASQSANWTNLFNNIGNVGRDEMNRKMTNGLYGYSWLNRSGDWGFNGQSRKSKRGGYLTVKTNNRRKE